MIPLQKTPLYSPDAYPSRYWTAPRNTTEWSVFMAELVNAGNALSRALLELLAPTLPGAHVGASPSLLSSPTPPLSPPLSPLLPSLSIPPLSLPSPPTPRQMLT